MQVQARSVASEARRAQIVDATIETLAEAGYQGTTFARIAAQARLSSTRLISYHFTDKDELLSAVFDRVVTAIGEWVGARVMAESTARGQLAAYINGVVSFTAEHRAAMRALLQIIMGGALPAAADSAGLTVPDHLVKILRDGRDSGEFRDLDPHVVAVCVQRSVEPLPFLLEAEPDLDIDAYARELVTLFDRGTRRSGRRSGSR